MKTPQRGRHRIGIAGAGIAGLAAAAFLARDGHDVTLFDQFDAPAPVGSGLIVQPVGLQVLDALGLADPLKAHAAPVGHIFGRNARGRAVLDVRYENLRPGLVGHAVQRALLFDLLYQAAEAAGVTIIPSTTLRSAEQNGAEVSLQWAEGRLGPFDLVLDCLGAYSPLCPKPSSPLAFGALWALLDWPNGGPFDPARLEQRYSRASHMVGILPVGTRPSDPQAKLTFFWSLRAQDHAAWRARPIDAWWDDVEGLWPDTRVLRDQIRAHDDLVFAQYTHRTLMRPGAGRIAHLGDSYHATSPQLGQGANMALLDAFALWSAVRACSDPAEAVAHYAAQRRRHVLTYQTASWLFTPFYQSDSRALPVIRDWVTAPISQVPPMPSLLARLVAGELSYRPPETSISVPVR